MKKVYRFFAAALALSFCAAACQQENLEPSAPQEESAGKTIVVNASMPNATKVAFTDESGLVWSENDNILARGKTNSATNASMTLTDATTASFKFGSLNPESVWFLKNYNLANSVDKVEFLYSNELTQAKAGVMNPDILKLKSQEVKITEETSELNVKMKLVGTVLRFLVYSSKGTYTSEKIQSVALVSSDTPISGSGAVIGYDLTTGKYHKDPNNNTQDECVIFWPPTPSTSTIVTLSESLSLNGLTSATQGTGIYMPVPPVKVGGYKYIVTTDQAIYTFDASTTECQFQEDQLKNILLDLDNTKVKRLGNTDTQGYIWFEGNPGNASIKSDAGFINSIGYTVAHVSDSEGANWTKRETRNSDEFIYNATYIYYDEHGNEISEEDSWLKVAFSPENICHWSLTYSANTSVEERTIKVKGTLVPPENYIIVTSETDLTPKDYVYEFTVTQKGNITVSADFSDVYASKVSEKGADIVAAKLNLLINSTPVSDVAAAMTNYDITLTATGGATIKNIAADGTVTMTIPENLYANGGKTYTLKVNYDGAVIASTEISQEEGTEEVVGPVYTYTASMTGYNWGQSWGFGSDFANTTTGTYLQITDIMVDGVTAAFTNSDEDKEVALALLKQAFKSTAPTAEEMAGHSTYAPVAVDFAVVECAGNHIFGAFVIGDGKSITKVTGYSDSGNELGSVIFWVD